MKKFLYLLIAAFVAVGLSACSPDDNGLDGPETEIPDTPENPENPNNPNPNPTSKTLCVLQFHEQCTYHRDRFANTNRGRRGKNRTC